jgi:hypothetical protein
MKLKIDNIFYLNFVESGLSTVIKKQFLNTPDLRLIYLNKIFIFKR